METHILSLCTFAILISIQIQRCFILAADVSEFPLPERFERPASVFDQFSDLQNKYNPLDLGPGSPDYNPSSRIKYNLAHAAMLNDPSLSQYSPDHGHPRLLKAISKLYSKLLNRTLDPDTDILVTVGATEALYTTFLSHTFLGDEWIIFEPFYEYYLPIIKSANGIPKFIKLKPKFDEAYNTTSADWSFDRKELSKLFNSKTKGILINNPHNPLGKIFTLDELTFIANLAKEWNTLVVCDEVYEFLTFDHRKQQRIATLPGMFERTITIGSAGKIFGSTGYRIGWAYGYAKIIRNLKQVHSLAVLCAPTPIQEAVAVALEREMIDLGKYKSFIERFKKKTEEKRNYLYRILSDAGMTPILPEGGYFMVANWTTMGSRVVLDIEENECEDYKFAKWLIKNVKVLALPLSSFYKDVNECSGTDLLRFSIIKAYENYETAEKLFLKWKL